jgi:hypothetical protein
MPSLSYFRTAFTNVLVIQFSVILANSEGFILRLPKCCELQNAFKNGECDNSSISSLSSLLFPEGIFQTNVHFLKRLRNFKAMSHHATQYWSNTVFVISDK